MSISTRPVVCAAAVIAVVCLFPRAAFASCDHPKNDAERAQCLGIELKGADATINRVYSNLMTTLPTAERTTLRDEQRRWIASRDKTCELGSSQGDRDAWLASLLRDYMKTVCVVRLTNERVQTLDAYAHTGHVAPPVAAAAAGADAVYDVAAPVAPAHGKWYFEITIDPARVIARGEAAIFIGASPATRDEHAIDPDGSDLGKLVTVRKIDTDLQPATYGFALDLDNGKLYLSDSGEWDGGAPGSAGGMDLIRGRSYRGAVESSIALNELLSSRAVVVNWGAAAFVYHTPDGYKPLAVK